MAIPAMLGAAVASAAPESVFAGTLPPFTTIGSGSGSGAAGLLAATDSVLAGFDALEDADFADSTDSDSGSLPAGVAAATSVAGSVDAGVVAVGAGAGSTLGLGCGCGVVAATGAVGVGVAAE